MRSQRVRVKKPGDTAFLSDEQVEKYIFEQENERVMNQGGEASVVVRNNDAFMHTFTIDELGVDVQLIPGSAEVITFPAEPGQTIAYYCVPHSSEGGDEPDDMAGTLAIE